MRVDEIRLKLTRDEKVLAYGVIVVDGLAIHDFRYIQVKGNRFVSMPSKKIMDRCHRCYAKNHVRAKFCNECGTALPGGRERLDDDGKPELFANVVHPIDDNVRLQIAALFRDAYDQAKRNPPLAGEDYVSVIPHCS